MAPARHLRLQWDAIPDTATADSIALLSQAEQTANLRRLIMIEHPVSTSRSSAPGE
jgi:hypothetical protein